jgi:GT2 family glycosyltransferase
VADPRTPESPEDLLAALRSENARLRERASEAERRLERVETELREIKQSGALRIGRLISRLLPGWLKHRLYDRFRRPEPLRSEETVPLAPRPGPGAQAAPIRFSVVVPVYGHARHLPAMLESLLGQTRQPEEIILVDDASPDPAVSDILARVAGRQGVRVLRNERNLGISATTNRGIATAGGTHLAFVDCDDLLEPRALAEVEALLLSRPDLDFVYTDRIDIDADGHELQRWQFAERAARPPLAELREGMFTSHLKVVSAAALREVGLFKSRYDLTQDYDLSLRLAERGRLGYLPDAVYRHRIHGSQQSQQQQLRQEQALERIRADSTRRERLRSATAGPLVSVLLEEGAHESDVRQTRASLEGMEGRWEIGSGGRLRSDYVLRLVPGARFTDPGGLARMLERLEESPELAGCCAKVVRQGWVLSSGGYRRAAAEGFTEFGLEQQGKAAGDLSTLLESRCDWLPRGASLWRRDVALRFAPAASLVRALQAQELAIRLQAVGLEVGTSPTVELEWNGHPGADDPARILESLRAIHREHGVLVENAALLRALGWDPRELAEIRARILRAG